MSTITLYASKVNRMSSLINNAKQSVKDYKSELNSLKLKLFTIDRSVCNVDDVISSIKSSTQTQEDKIESLESLNENVNEYISDVVTIDQNAADAINQSKNDFYDKYEYLKPDIEKNESGWTKFWKSVGEWCKEHWKAVVTIVLVIAAVAIIVFTAGTALGPLASLLLMVAKGTLIGTTIGGLVGGAVSAATGGSFWEGLENGAFSGAISGAISGGMGSWLSGGGHVALSLGKTMIIGAVADTVASLLSDLGDIIIKGENISFGEILFNASFSFVLGGVFSGVGYGFAEKFPIKISGINKGNGSWAHVWASQSTRSIRYGSKVSLKTLLKGFGSGIINDIWDYILEPFKNITDKHEDLWNVIIQN